MAVLELTLVPIGGQGTSASPYIAKAYQVVKDREDMVVELTPMGTILEGEPATLMQAVQDMQEAVFAMGIKRVYSVIKIDDRRDRPHPMHEKTKAVLDKIKD